ncbi:MAG: DUF3179 domain-containing (seleno)protein [Ilumatobacteraceae bacterium]
MGHRPRWWTWSRFAAAVPARRDPSIDEPAFVTAADVNFLADNELILAVDIGGDVRAYPVQILMWHEIVNDTVGGIPVAVTYCPLCNSAVAYDRRIDDRIMEFGTSGLLWNSALVMYDRQTETVEPLHRAGHRRRAHRRRARHLRGGDGAVAGVARREPSTVSS